MSAHTESHEEMMKRHREERSRHREKAAERAHGGKAEHEKRARGGESKGGPGAIGEDGSMKGMESYTADHPDVEKEAERRAKGGALRKEKMPRMVHGEAPRHHVNRPGRKSGGSIGADSHPMTEAARLSAPEGLSRNSGVDREDD